MRIYATPKERTYSSAQRVAWGPDPVSMVCPSLYSCQAMLCIHIVLCSPYRPIIRYVSPFFSSMKQPMDDAEPRPPEKPPRKMYNPDALALFCPSCELGNRRQHQLPVSRRRTGHSHYNYRALVRFFEKFFQ